MRNILFLLDNVEEETKIQCGNDIKIGAAEIGKFVVDSNQSFEESALAEFTEFGNETPGNTGSEQLLDLLAT